MINRIWVWLVFQKGLKGTARSFQSEDLSLWKIGQQFVPITICSKGQWGLIHLLASSCSSLIHQTDFNEKQSGTMDDKWGTDRWAVHQKIKKDFYTTLIEDDDA